MLQVSNPWRADRIIYITITGQGSYGIQMPIIMFSTKCRKWVYHLVVFLVHLNEDTCKSTKDFVCLLLQLFVKCCFFVFVLASFNTVASAAIINQFNCSCDCINNKQLTAPPSMRVCQWCLAERVKLATWRTTVLYLTLQSWPATTDLLIVIWLASELQFLELSTAQTKLFSLFLFRYILRTDL